MASPSQTNRSEKMKKFSKTWRRRPPNNIVLNSTCDESSNTLHEIGTQVLLLRNMWYTWKKSRKKHLSRFEFVQIGHRNICHGTRRVYSLYEIKLENKMKNQILKVDLLDRLENVISCLIEHVPNELRTLHHWRDVVINVKRLLFDIESLHCDGNMLTRKITVENCKYLQIGTWNEVQFGDGLVESPERFDEDWFNLAVSGDDTIRVVFRQYGSYLYRELDLWPRRSHSEIEITKIHPTERNRDEDPVDRVLTLDSGGQHDPRLELDRRSSDHLLGGRRFHSVIESVVGGAVRREILPPVCGLDSGGQHEFDRCSSSHQLGGQRFYSVVESEVGRDVMREILGNNNDDISSLRGELRYCRQRIKHLRPIPLTEITEVTVIGCPKVQMGIWNTMTIK